MKRLSLLVCLAGLLGFAWCLGAWACTTMIVTKGASADGSMMVAHSDDDELGDQRLIRVPPRKQVGHRMIYREHYRYPRIVTDDRGPGYRMPGHAPTAPLFELPYAEIWRLLGREVRVSYAYFDGNYGIMNEHNLMIGECTNAANFQPKPNGDPAKKPLRIFYTSELSRIALENCRTAREAIRLMGALIDRYGYYSTGETLLVADADEAWVFEMCALPDTRHHSAWVARQVPDGMVFVAANEFRIRDVDFDDPAHFMVSEHLAPGLKKLGWWDPEKGSLDWLRAVSPGEYNHPYYSLRRVWRVLDRVNPDLGLSPWVADGYTRAYPFAVAPSRKLGPRDVFSLYRDHYEGTPFDLTRGTAAGPYGDPHRFVGPYDGLQNNVSKDKKMVGAWERAISVFYQGYSFVCQLRPTAPAATRGILWYGPDVSYTTCFAPFFTAAASLPDAYQAGDPQEFSRDSAWWAFNFVNNWSRLNFQRMTRNDIIPLQQRLEAQAEADIGQLDRELSGVSADSARHMVTAHAAKHAEDLLKAWWRLSDTLVAKYSDGYINLPDGTVSAPDTDRPVAVGYPDTWLEKTNYANGPTTYDMPRP